MRESSRKTRWEEPVSYFRTTVSTSVRSYVRSKVKRTLSHIGKYPSKDIMIV